ncbi:MAG TPA: DUF6544 family protein [Haliangium sp.]|nr:DUF6544 family protein [Haliangium sp.]
MLPQPQIVGRPARYSLPGAARRYLAHAVTSHAPSTHAVELALHGEIKHRGRWLPFQASEWLDPASGFEWRGIVRWGPMRIQSCDRLLGGRSETRWSAFQHVSLVSDQGPHLARHHAGRAALEALWVPTWLASPAVTWTENPDGTVRARWRVGREGVAIDLVLDPGGRPRSARMLRWGNPDGQGWRPVPFGARFDAERTVAGVRVPARMTAGWWFGDERFEREGICLRVTLDDLKPVTG